jgi:hypothetical protein
MALKKSPKPPRPMNPIKPVKVAECTVLHLDAGHDRNGNPRRLFLVLHRTGEIVAAVDEGYIGPRALEEYIPKVGKTLREMNYCTIKTTAGEYRALLRRFGRGEPDWQMILP